jgi:Domain of unknown function (DUF5600)
MPTMFGKDSRKKELINNLGSIYAEIQREYQISPGDFPDLQRMQEQLQHHVTMLLITFVDYFDAVCDFFGLNVRNEWKVRVPSTTLVSFHWCSPNSFCPS